jgi:hypothetical protein
VTTNSTPPAPVPDQLPRHSASEAPVTRSYRIAWFIWVASVLLTVGVTVILYLIDKIYLATTR